MTSIVTEKDVKHQISNTIRQLRKADRRPQVYLPKEGKPSLVVTRLGMTAMLPISNRVAEELIAMGLGHEG